MPLEQTLQNDQQRTKAIRELQSFTQVIVTGAAAATNIAIAGLTTTDVIAGALNLTDLTGVTRDAVKAEAAALTTNFDTVLEAHTAGVAGNAISVRLMGDSVLRVAAEYGPSWPGGYNSVVNAVTPGTAGNDISLILIGDSGGGAGVTINKVGTVFTIHYESGVSTIAHVDAAINALAGGDKLIEVIITGTGATTLTAPADNFGSINLVGGVTGGGVAINRTGTDFVIFFEDGYSTVAHVETAIAALAGGDNLFGTKTGGTGATVLSTLDDTMAAPVNLTGGLAASTSELPTITSAGNIQFATTDTSDKKLLISYYSVV